MAFLDFIKKNVGLNTGSFLGTFNPFSQSKFSGLKPSSEPQMTPLPTQTRTPFQPPQQQITPEANAIMSQTPNVKLSVQNLTTPISSSSLTNQEMTIPETNSTSANDSLSSSLEGVFAVGTQELSTRDNYMQSISDLIKEQGTQADFTAEMQEDVQLAEKRQALADINARYDRISKQYDDQIRDIDKTFNTPQQYNAQVEEISRKKNERLADLAIQQMAIQGNVDTALQIVNDAVRAKYEPIKQQIQGYQTFMSLYNDDLSSSEKILLENQIQAQQQQYESGVKSEQLTRSANAWEQAIQQGTKTWKDVPNELIPYMSPTIQKQFKAEEIDPLMDTFTSISDLITAGGLSGAVGPNWFARLSPASKVTGEKQNFIAGIEQLVSQETLDTLVDLKSQGGTLGALSDQERIMLRNAATKIGGWAVTDSDGNVKGYNTTEQAFKKELQTYLDTAGKALLRADGVPMETKKDVLTTQTILKYPNASDEDVADIVNQALPQYISAFNSAGNASASTIANAIKKVESGGNYSAKGQSGELGAYQFMPDTWRQWAGEFLGNPNAPLTQRNQDFVAQSKINQLVLQGYTPEQIALIWNAGTPVRRSGVNKFGVRYDSGAYADKVLKQLT